MDLNSPAFLFIFFPFFLIVYFIGSPRWRTAFLFFFSLVFLIWGDPLYFPVSFSLALITYWFLLGIQKHPADDRKQKRLRILGVAVNLACLLFFKILAAYGQSILSLAVSVGMNAPARLISLMPRLAQLPLGFSFLTFQAISLLLDAPYETAENENQFLPALLHLLMFPKAVSGPLVRFDQLRPQIENRDLNLSQFAAGLRRFMLGFAKKALIADQLALITDRGIFTQSPLHIPAGVAWLVLLSFTLQIYFDFSAYSDMAIGLGQMLGFKFPENFNDPYWSVSITDFWRRWHMTLSAWFRDYIFYPLEKKRALAKKGSQSLNILTVFLLTGLWHGITLPFLIWGLLQGSAIVLERGAFGRWLRGLWRPFQHLYALLVIMTGWVFFRSPNLAYALKFIKTLVNIFKSAKPLPYSAFPPIAKLTWIAFAAGMLLSLPLKGILHRILPEKLMQNSGTCFWVQNILILALFIVAILVQAGSKYQPFIYGDF